MQNYVERGHAGGGEAVDLVGKGGHIRTVPMPIWVKNAVDRMRKKNKRTRSILIRGGDIGRSPGDFAPTEILGSMSRLPNTHPETFQLLSRARSFV